MENTIWMYGFGAIDEDGQSIDGLKKIENSDFKSADELKEQVVQFLSQTDEAYIDEYGFVHEIYDNVDQIYALYFDVEDDDWYEIIGILGEYLDNDMISENSRLAAEEVYNKCLQIAEGKIDIIQQPTVKTVGL